MAEITIPDIGITKLLNSLTSGLYMAVGTDGTEGAAGDTTIAGEITRQSIGTYNVTAGSQIQFQCYFSSALVGGQTIRKAAVFDAVSGGNLLCEKVVSLVVPAGQGALVTINYPMARV